jgi:hypothetical protein
VRVITGAHDRRKRITATERETVTTRIGIGIVLEAAAVEGGTRTVAEIDLRLMSSVA